MWHQRTLACINASAVGAALPTSCLCKVSLLHVHMGHHGHDHMLQPLDLGRLGGLGSRSCWDGWDWVPSSDLWEQWGMGWSQLTHGDNGGMGWALLTLRGHLGIGWVQVTLWGQWGDRVGSTDLGTIRDRVGAGDPVGTVGEWGSSIDPMGTVGV